MTNRMDGRPFSQRLEEIKTQRGYRYSDLESEAGRARSSAWFNSLLNSSRPWRVGPPSNDTIESLAELLETTEEHVRRMIAEEWYGVAQAKQSTRVAGLAQRLDQLSSEDARLVEEIIQRLLKGDSGSSSKRLVRRKSSPPPKALRIFGERRGGLTTPELSVKKERRSVHQPQQPRFEPTCRSMDDGMRGVEAVVGAVAGRSGCEEGLEGRDQR